MNECRCGLPVWSEEDGKCIWCLYEEEVEHGLVSEEKR